VKELHDGGTFLPVIHLEIDYLAPAVLDDLIRVETAVLETTGGTLTLRQRVVLLSDGKHLVDARVSLACLGPGGRPIRLPKALIAALQAPGRGPRPDDRCATGITPPE
jgi:acyl-CoA thioester hydrolase